jgi:2-oxoglutarate dioxygenase / 2-oxoglutarate/L-arginine monooxygenase/decarboxylase
VSKLATFRIPEIVSGQSADVDLGHQVIRAWQTSGIFQIGLDADAWERTQRAFEASKRFFASPLQEKSRLVSERSSSGYIASGVELTAGEADYSEIFTVCKDVPLGDPRARAEWPCHGPVPWPDAGYRYHMRRFMAELGTIGENVLRLTALGLGLPLNTLTDLTMDGWHHMRVLRFPGQTAQTSRGIGAHTDYGLLVIAAQDQVGGLYVRPPVEAEHRNRNWRDDESSAGMYENDEPWHRVEPVPGVLTVFPGDILQFLTSGALLSTPHKVRLNTQERFSMAYFHEPNFQACVRPLSDPSSNESIHYGTHFTNMFMRCYLDRITTRGILDEGRLQVLAQLREQASSGSYIACDSERDADSLPSNVRLAG